MPPIYFCYERFTLNTLLLPLLCLAVSAQFWFDTSPVKALQINHIRSTQKKLCFSFVTITSHTPILPKPPLACRVNRLFFNAGSVEFAFALICLHFFGILKRHRRGALNHSFITNSVYVFSCKILNPLSV